MMMRKRSKKMIKVSENKKKIKNNERQLKMIKEEDYKEQTSDEKGI